MVITKKIPIEDTHMEKVKNQSISLQNNQWIAKTEQEKTRGTKKLQSRKRWTKWQK